MCIEARTRLRRRSRQVAMTYDLGFWEDPMQVTQQVAQAFRLFDSARVRWQPVLVQSTLIANADRAMVVRHGVCPNLQQHPMLCHRTVTTDIEVITNLSELTRAMVTEQLLHRIILVAPCSRAVHHKILNVVGRHQILTFHKKQLKIKHKS